MSASDDGQSNSPPEEKSRLTEVEKRNNHVASGTFPLAPSPSRSAPSRPHPTDTPRSLCPTLSNIPWSLIEKKRREAIRFAFDRLTTLVPGLEGQGRSEGVVLQRTAEFLHEQLSENRRLADELETRGGDVPEHLKM